MSNENKAIKKIILFSVIFLIVGGVAGYFIGENSAKANFRGRNANFPNSNFQINDTVKAEIISFFDNTQDAGQISTYCKNNPRYCIEYCRNINPSNEVCNTLNISFGGGVPAK
jgi:hypothetical protein